MRMIQEREKTAKVDKQWISRRLSGPWRVNEVARRYISVRYSSGDGSNRRYRDRKRRSEAD